MSTQQNTEAARGARTVGAPEVAALQLAAAQLAEGAYVPEVRAGAQLQGRGRGPEPLARPAAVPAAASTPVPTITPAARRGFFARLMAWLLGRR